MALCGIVLRSQCFLQLRHTFGIVGILNLTTDSFYPPSRSMDINKSVSRALDLFNDGADVVDIGAESSRPGSTALPPGVESARLLPVIKEIKQLVPRVTLSVDTWHAKTAADVLEAGVEIINDISACRFDPELLEVIVQYKPAYILMHSSDIPEKMQNSTNYDDVVREVYQFFDTHLNRLVKAGLPENRIILDPGIGFGKLANDNIKLLKNIDKFKVWERPLMVGLSNKSLFGDLFQLKVEERATITQVATSVMWQKGVLLHRVHDVKATSHSLFFSSRLLSA